MTPSERDTASPLPEAGRPAEVAGRDVPPPGRMGLRVKIAVTIAAVLLAAGPAVLPRLSGLFVGTVQPPAGLVLVRGAALVATTTQGGSRTLVAMPAGGEAGAPALSPDGHNLAFTVARGAYGDPAWGTDLYALPLDTAGAPAGPPRLLLRHAQPGDAVESAAWAPDGRALLVGYRESVYADGAYRGYRLRLDRFGVTTGRRATLLRDASDPAWSPDGRRIAYVRTDPARRTQSLWTAEPDGGNAVRVTDDGFGAVQAPRFSPDGSRLLFAGLGSGALARSPDRDGWLSGVVAPRAAAHGIPWNLWVWSADGQPRQLTRLGQDQIYGAWSPSGERVALVTDMGLYIIERDGTDLARIDAPADPRGLAWLRTGPRRGK